MANHQILLKEEEAVLENPRKRKYLERLNQGSHRPIPKKANTILLSPIFLQKKTLWADSFKNLQVGSRMVVISHTIRDKPWTEAIELWLEENTFKELTRGTIPLGWSWNNVRAFVVILRGCKGISQRQDWEDFVQKTREACNAIANGKKLQAEYMRRFKPLIVHEHGQLEFVRLALERNKLLKKNLLDSENDMLIVFSTGDCKPFNRAIEYLIGENSPISPDEEEVAEDEDAAEDEDQKPDIYQ